mgnify:FL=1|jgi:hypothetical protein
MNKLTILIALLCSLPFFGTSQQHKCASHSNWEALKSTDSNAQLRMESLEKRTQEWIAKNVDIKTNGSAVVIPVVVHVIYHESVENISESQIQSQINVLNADFNLLNADSLLPDNPFWYDSADCQIEFCLAQQDPDGLPSSGITRTYTETLAFDGNGDEKYTAYGGRDNWDPESYMNLWVCNLTGSGGTLGYATFPSELEDNPYEDGVVIHYEAFGTTGTAGNGDFLVNDLGRTGSHEVGHWLNLRHIWGDEPCGNDFCADTPEHESENYGCPTFPHLTYNDCLPGTSENGEMYMNYMDYVNDACMNMFSFDQSARMDAAIFEGRSGLLTSSGCEIPVVGVNEHAGKNELFSIYPNPSSSHFYLDLGNTESSAVELTLYDSSGKIIQNLVKEFREITGVIDIEIEESGVYYINLITEDNTETKRIIKL